MAHCGPNEAPPVDAAMFQLPALVRVVVRIARSPQNRSKKDTKNPSSQARDG